MNFIIYEDEKEYSKRYKDIICKLVGLQAKKVLQVSTN